MERSATDIMQDILVAAVMEAIAAWKQASGGLPNVLARELGAVHPNTTLADLPKEVQAALQASVRTAFNKLLKEGYAVAKGAPQPPRGPRPDGPRGGPHAPRPDGPRGPRSDGPRPPRRNSRPPVVEVKRPPRGPRGPKSD